RQILAEPLDTIGRNENAAPAHRHEATVFESHRLQSRRHMRLRHGPNGAIAGGQDIVAHNHKTARPVSNCVVITSTGRNHPIPGDAVARAQDAALLADGNKLTSPESNGRQKVRRSRLSLCPVAAVARGPHGAASADGYESAITESDAVEVTLGFRFLPG